MQHLHGCRPEKCRVRCVDEVKYKVYEVKCMIVVKECPRCCCECDHMSHECPHCGYQGPGLMERHARMRAMSHMDADDFDD